MNLPADVADDWRGWDGLEAATLNVVGPVGVYTPKAIGSGGACCLFRKGSTREGAPSGGVYTAFRQRVIVPANQLPAGVVPKPADQVVRAADGSTLTVLAVDANVYDSLYFLDAVDLVLAAGLRSTATLSRPANTTDAAGKRVPGFAAAADNIPCRVQYEGGRRADTFDAPAVLTRATAYLGQRVLTELGDRFDVDGQKWTVVGWNNPDRLDELMTLELEQRA